MFNLSLLSSDAFAIIAGIFLFDNTVCISLKKQIFIFIYLMFLYLNSHLRFILLR